MPVTVTRTDYRLDKVLTIHSVRDTPRFNVSFAESSGGSVEEVDGSNEPFTLGNDTVVGDGWAVALWQETAAQGLNNIFWEPDTFFTFTFDESLNPGQRIYRGARVIAFGEVLPASRFVDDNIKPVIEATSDGGFVNGITRGNPLAGRLAVRLQFDVDTMPDFSAIASESIIGELTFDRVTTFIQSTRAAQTIAAQILADDSVADQDPEGDTQVSRTVDFITRSRVDVADAVEIDGVLLSVEASTEIGRTAFRRCRASASYPINAPPFVGIIL